MQYIEVKCHIQPADLGNEIVTAFLAEIGYESFMETEDGTLLAYIQQAFFNEKKLKHLLDGKNVDFTFSYEINTIQEENWNAVWESNYKPVLIENTCFIRAPFHEKRKNVQYDIVIEPKMSFGTAHHETTALMISYLLEEDCNNKTVLDMGSGTGVLAILASIKNAKKVYAIDNDKWAYDNCIENFERNKVKNIQAILGNASHTPNIQFDIITANINRNVLVQDMNTYVQHLKPTGIVLLSGFYANEDMDIIKANAATHGLHYHSYKQKNQWAAVKFYK